MKPDTAFILAAGLGTRLRPLTDTTPKPLTEVTGRSLIERALDQTIEAGVTRAVVNLHHLGDQIETRLKTRPAPAITFSHEDTLLDTGGGIKKALPYCGKKPFYVLSGDALWTDGPGGNALLRLAETWNPDTMDILLLLQPLSAMKITTGSGDYDLVDGRPMRSKTKTGVYVFTSIRLNHPRIFEGTPDGAFSYLALMDHAESRGRLHALIHDGEWHHISTPKDLQEVNACFAAQGK